MAHKRSIRCGLACGLLALTSTAACFGAGVTVITHGYDDGTATWITAMANSIAVRLGGLDKVAQFTLTIGRNPVSGSIEVRSFVRDAGSPPFDDSLDSTEAIVKVDWSEVAGSWGIDVLSCYDLTSTRLVAQAAASGLMVPSTATGGRTLAELPIHLIGHSRGGSVVAEIARVLGANGIWIDQLTTLDPHPIHCEGTSFPGNSDASVNVYENVLFADNYYETAFPYPHGASVFGAYNRLIGDLPDGYGFPAYNHNNMHLWYYGTVDLRTPISDYNVIIDQSKRETWWLPGEDQGAATGFLYSRLGGGNRRSSTDPAGDSSNPIAKGYNFNVMNGARFNRTDLTVSGYWPNVITLTNDATTPVVIGQDIGIGCALQTYNSSAEVVIGLDSDQNPYNGDAGYSMPANTFVATGGNITKPGYLWNTTGMTAGKYYLCAKITSQPAIPLLPRTRYLYSSQPITLQPAGGGGITYLPAPNLISPANGSGGQSTTLTFSWSQVNGATSYRIMIATNLVDLTSDPTVGACPNCVLNDTTVGTSYTLTSIVLNPGATYYWQVHARSPDYFGTWSAKDSFTTASAITWTGAVSSDWNNLTNWSPMIVPGSGDIVVINSGTVSMPPSPNFLVLQFAGGTLYGDFTNTGTMNWQGGSLYGDLTIASGGVLNLSGSTDKTLYGVVTNAGTVRWTGAGDLVLDGGRIYNLALATFDVQTDRYIQCGFSTCGWFDNAGLLRKSGGGGTAYFLSIPLTNSGTVDVQSGTLRFGGFTQTAGATRLTGGSLSGGTLNFNGGTLSGSGIIGASVVNAAEVSPGASPGTITINGSYTQTSAGTLNIEIGGLSPGSGFDQLVVNGPATLAGALNATLINGFTPAFSDAFPVLTYASRSGSFTGVNLPALPNALALTTRYGPSDLTLLTANTTGNNATNTLLAVANAPGPLELRFTGEPGQAYRLQASTNLTDWINLFTNTPVNGLFRFVDSEATNMDRRFYRTVSP